MTSIVRWTDNVLFVEVLVCPLWVWRIREKLSDLRTAWPRDPSLDPWYSSSFLLVCNIPQSDEFHRVSSRDHPWRNMSDRDRNWNNVNIDIYSKKEYSWLLWTFVFLPHANDRISFACIASCFMTNWTHTHTEQCDVTDSIVVFFTHRSLWQSVDAMSEAKLMFAVLDSSSWRRYLHGWFRRASSEKEIDTVQQQNVCQYMIETALHTGSDVVRMKRIDMIEMIRDLNNNWSRGEGDGWIYLE